MPAGKETEAQAASKLNAQIYQDSLFGPPERDCHHRPAKVLRCRLNLALQLVKRAAGAHPVGGRQPAGVKHSSGGPLVPQRGACCTSRVPSFSSCHRASFTCHPLVPVHTPSAKFQAAHPALHPLPSPPVVQVRPHVSAAAPPQLLQRVRKRPKCLSKAARDAGGDPHAALKARLRLDLNAWRAAAVRAAVALHPAGMRCGREAGGRLGGKELAGGRLQQQGCRSEASRLMSTHLLREAAAAGAAGSSSPEAVCPAVEAPRQQVEPGQAPAAKGGARTPPVGYRGPAWGGVQLIRHQL